MNPDGVRFFRASLIGCAVCAPVWLLLVLLIYMACSGCTDPKNPEPVDIQIRPLHPAGTRIHFQGAV